MRAQPSSVAKRVLERMDAFLGETDVASDLQVGDRVSWNASQGRTRGEVTHGASALRKLKD